MAGSSVGLQIGDSDNKKINSIHQNFELNYKQLPCDLEVIKKSNTNSNFWSVLEHPHIGQQAEHTRLNQASWLFQSTDKKCKYLIPTWDLDACNGHRRL